MICLLTANGHDGVSERLPGAPIKAELPYKEPNSWTTSPETRIVLIIIYEKI